MTRRPLRKTHGGRSNTLFELTQQTADTNGGSERDRIEIGHLQAVRGGLVLGVMIWCRGAIVLMMVIVSRVLSTALQRTSEGFGARSECGSDPRHDIPCDEPLNRTLMT